MYLPVPFDGVAPGYDAQFSNSRIGRLQRRLVWNKLAKVMDSEKPLHILDIGCGTGEDAIMLANQGHSVVATDISSEMIRIAKQKYSGDRIQFRIASLPDIYQWNEKYDWIFSDFGALNCMGPEALSELNEKARTMLNPDGRLVFVFLGKYCFTERFYYFLKGDKKGMHRRMKAVEVDLGSGVSQMTWFYSAREIEKIFDGFVRKHKAPVGLFVPPSFAEENLKKNAFLLPVINAMEWCFGGLSSFADAGDHMFITLTRRGR